MAHDLFVHHSGSRTFQGSGIDAEGCWRRTVAGSPRHGNACRQRAGRGVQTLDRAGTRKSKTESTMYEHGFTRMGIRCADGSKGRRGGTSCWVFEFSFRSVFHRWLKNLRFAGPPLARTTGAYEFWIDADDVVDPPEREKLRQLLEGLRSDGAGRGAAKTPGDATPTPAPPLQGTVSSPSFSDRGSQALHQSPYPAMGFQSAVVGWHRPEFIGQHDERDPARVPLLGATARRGIPTHPSLDTPEEGFDLRPERRPGRPLGSTPFDLESRGLRVRSWSRRWASPAWSAIRRPCPSCPIPRRAGPPARRPR